MAERARKAYQNFLVSVELHSSRRSLGELSRLMKRRPSDNSFERGELSGRKGTPRTSTVWQICVHSSKALPLNTLIARIATDALSRRLRLVKRRYKEVALILNIGVLYKGAYASISLSEKHVKWCADAGVKIDFSSYPCSD
jgi:hypothetical protein